MFSECSIHWVPLPWALTASQPGFCGLLPRPFRNRLLSCSTYLRKAQSYTVSGNLAINPNLAPKPLNQPRTPQDYRPISITPILSRIMEKSLVRSLLILKHPDYSQNFSDQFGFRPTGSTTAMLIYLFQELTNMLQEQSTSSHSTSRRPSTLSGTTASSPSSEDTQYQTASITG